MRIAIIIIGILCVGALAAVRDLLPNIWERAGVAGIGGAIMGVVIIQAHMLHKGTLSKYRRGSAMRVEYCFHGRHRC